ncbi:MAG TPA: efflux RND transporter periplasmic adaptor subunit [Rhizomicrobium sp.]|nr:efflux RND transporter periplasmic adaptor subunit [Rhizomicrobium sp.]
MSIESGTTVKEFGIGAPAVPQGLRKPRERLASVADRKWLIAAFVLALIAFGVHVLRGNVGTPLPYVTADVARGDIEDTVTALGNLQPRDYVDVGAQATGQLKKLYVDIGYTVKQGQLLAEIDPQVASAKVEQDEGNLANLKAQLADKQAQLSLADANFMRQRGLNTANATSRADYDSAAQAARSAAAEVNALKGQIAAAVSQLNGDKVTLGYTKIYAPMSGTVASVSIKQGQTINSVQQAPTILRIADLKTMTVWTQVSEADVPKLKIGMPAYFTTLGNPDKRWYGKLQQIQPTPTITNNVVLYTATFDVANPTNELMTQMTAQVFFVTASAHDVVTVPVSALHNGRGRAGGRTGSWTPKQGQGPAAHRIWSNAARASVAAIRSAMKAPGAKRYFVVVVKPDGTLGRRPVVIGVMSRVSAEVLAGLKPGDKVVVGMRSTDGPGSHAHMGANGHSAYSHGRLGGFP